VGLGAVAAVRLKGTLRHDKNSCGRRRLLLKLLAIAAISEYTRLSGIFPARSVCVFWVCQESEYARNLRQQRRNTQQRWTHAWSS
jgi:hypothetical protein